MLYHILLLSTNIRVFFSFHPLLEPMFFAQQKYPLGVEKRTNWDGNKRTSLQFTYFEIWCFLAGWYILAATSPCSHSSHPLSTGRRHFYSPVRTDPSLPRQLLLKWVGLGHICPMIPSHTLDLRLLDGHFSIPSPPFWPVNWPWRWTRGTRGTFWSFMKGGRKESVKVVQG